LFLLLLFLMNVEFYSQTLLDNFESEQGWEIFKADGVETKTSLIDGYHGKGIKFDYNFTKGTGYGGIQKIIPLDLSGNFQFTFYIKAESPDNNFEFKLIDSNGQNVWWINNRNYKFPKEWTKIKIKKRDISFAWGPTEDITLKKIDKIEFTIASFVGGKGTIYIDELKFEPLPAEDNSPITSIASASSELNDFAVKNINDGNRNTEWKSNNEEYQMVVLFLGKKRELGGLVIDWNKEDYAEDFDVYLSEGQKEWRKVYSVKGNKGDRSYIRLKEEDALSIKIEFLKSSRGNGYGIKEIDIKNIGYTKDINRFFINVAKDFPRGYFPRYFYEEASYWNVIGVNGDVKEALINEDGMIEVDKTRFSIEPVLYTNNKFITWNDVDKENLLEENYLPIPIVRWRKNDLALEIKSFAEGETNKNSILYSLYKVKNNGDEGIKGKLLLLIRPFQVNPYYQWLNISGGVSGISGIKIRNQFVFVDNDKVIYSFVPFDDAGALKFEEGNILSLIAEKKFNPHEQVEDQLNLANGILVYDYSLKPGEEKEIILAIPFHESNIEEFKTNTPDNNRKFVYDLLEKNKNFWRKKISHVKFRLPQSADQIINTFYSNLAYILINRDNFGIQPGSRSYERSWIRDGALTSSALLKSGIVEEVKEFINWYSAYQYENGKVPCVVDSRGPDPVPENDSHGELIYLIKEYFNFTKDTTFLKSKNENIKQAVSYLKELISQRSTDKYKEDSLKAYYGILPESISHEGYSAKPMHSYWDDFFGMKGLKDAVEIQRILGEEKMYKSFSVVRDEFKKNLYNSLKLAITKSEIDYIPGCVELGDFDATSTTIALNPCNEFPNLPQPYLDNTFEKYYKYFTNRRDGKTEWVNYTPYEVRTIGSFVFLDKPSISHELIDFFIKDQKPQGWNHWAEVVWKDDRYPGYIGDMPHTWVGSDFINTARTLFVYENDHDSSLVIGAGLYPEWIDAKEGMSVENLSTYYGELSYSVNKKKNKYTVKLYGDIVLPAGGIILKNFNNSKVPERVLINEKEIQDFTKSKIVINEFPASIEIIY
jgi:hypothetical protein